MDKKERKGQVEMKKEELKAVIQGRGCAERIPMLYDLWIYPQAMGEQAGQVQELLERNPGDAS